MTIFKTGAHTIEFQTPKQLDLSRLPPAYKGAVRTEGTKAQHYVMNMTKIPDMQEYSSPADTQRAIENAFTLFYDMGTGYPKTTRLDYRFDDHSGAYADHLQPMTVLVNLIAEMSGIYGRRVFYADGNGVITSVRCMPDKKDSGTKYGAEYYDKLKEKGSAVNGNARLELRRLNMSGESVQYVLREWRDMLKSMTKAKYLFVLEEHARSLYGTKQDGESAAKFITRILGNLIAYEEWHIIHKLSGKHTKNYHRVKHLPKWAEMKTFIDNLTAQIDDALAQPPSSSCHPVKATSELPF